MVQIQNVKRTVGPIWNTGGIETEIIIPVSVLGPQRAGTKMGSDPRLGLYVMIIFSGSYWLHGHLTNASA